MTVQQEFAGKLTLVGLVTLFVLACLYVLRNSGQFSAPALGETVPNFTLRSEDGQVVALGDFRGKIVLLNFWATWCPPCIEEMPSLNRLAEQNADKGLQIIGVSVDENADAYQEFLSRNKISFLTVRDASRGTSDRYGTFKLPESYVVSREGRLLRKVIGAADWTSQEMLTYFEGLLTGKGS
ncbi:MAG: TlpA family protein disulfide reductase [Terriglobia bacterium]